MFGSGCDFRNTRRRTSHGTAVSLDVDRVFDDTRRQSSKHCRGVPHQRRMPTCGAENKSRPNEKGSVVHHVHQNAETDTEVDIGKEWDTGLKCAHAAGLIGRGNYND